MIRQICWHSAPWESVCSVPAGRHGCDRIQSMCLSVVHYKDKLQMVKHLTYANINIADHSLTKCIFIKTTYCIFHET